MAARRTSTVTAFQGEPGAFSWIAATKLVGERAKPLPRPTFIETFAAVRDGRADFAVIPIENTLYGSVHENYDNLLRFGFPIIAETNVRIEHHLIGMPGVRLMGLKQVFSHPVALGQCRRFFEKYSGIAATPFYDTAGSVKMLSQERPANAAAIASSAAAALYGGRILKANIEDNSQNYTRFFLLSKQAAPRRLSSNQGWKTSVVFAAANAPGALFKALACFALRDLSLTKIESRPLRDKPWEYLFHLDILGHAQTPAVSKALDHLAEISPFTKILGTYYPVD